MSVGVFWQHLGFKVHSDFAHHPTMLREEVIPDVISKKCRTKRLFSHFIGNLKGKKMLKIKLLEQNRDQKEVKSRSSKLALTCKRNFSKELVPKVWQQPKRQAVHLWHRAWVSGALHGATLGSLRVPSSSGRAAILCASLSYQTVNIVVCISSFLQPFFTIIFRVKIPPPLPQ